MKRKLLITNPYNILVFENWLSDLALQGLYPKKIGHIFGEFICDEPLKTDYKIEISNASEKKEQKELYLEQGWKEVVSKDKITIYSRPSEQVEKAAQTFASSQMNTLGNVKRKRDNMFCLLLMWIVASALVIYNILFQSGTPILNLVNEGEQILYYLLADIFLGIIIVKNYKDIFDTYRYLKSGNKVKKPISWKHSKNFSNLLIGFSVPLLIMIFVNGYYLFLNIQYLKDNGEDVYCNKRYSMISLQNIGRDQGEKKYNFIIRKRTSILSKEIYTVREDMLSSSGSSSMEICSYNLKTESLVSYAMSDLMKYDLQPYDSLHIDKNNVGGVGEVLICILNDTVYCYIVESTEIIRVKYVGNENVEDIVKLIRETYKEKRIDCYMW